MHSESDWRSPVNKLKPWEWALLAVVVLSSLTIASAAVADARGYVLDLLWWIRR